jgi:hypothetical protein
MIATDFVKYLLTIGVEKEKANEIVSSLTADLEVVGNGGLYQVRTYKGGNDIDTWDSLAKKWGWNSGKSLAYHNKRRYGANLKGTEFINVQLPNGVDPYSNEEIDEFNNEGANRNWFIRFFKSLFGSYDESKPKYKKDENK